MFYALALSSTHGFLVVVRAQQPPRLLHVQFLQCHSQKLNSRDYLRKWPGVDSLCILMHLHLQPAASFPLVVPRARAVVPPLHSAYAPAAERQPLSISLLDEQQRLLQEFTTAGGLLK